MPIYEFKCNNCGNIFTELRKVFDVSPIQCSDCESLNTKKLMSTFSTASSSSKSSGCMPAGGG